MRMFFRSLVTFSLIAVVSLASVASAQRIFLSIGGGFVGGTFNVFAAGIGDYLGQQFPNFNITVEGSAGSAENIRRMQAGEMEMGIAFAGDAYLAFNAMEDFDDMAYDRIRAIGFLYGAVSQITVLQNSGINSLADLAGKRVALGQAGSGTHLSIERLLRTAGLFDKVTPVFIAGQAASDALKDGQIDAYHSLLGVPNAAMTDTFTSRQAKILATLADAEAAGFFDAYPFYSGFSVPAGSYPGVDGPVETWRDAGIWIVTADMDEDLVYRMTKAIYDPTGLQHMLRVTNVAREMGLENALSGIALPLHPGAARYWAEVGVDIPAVALP
jgi:TRAP transporter TAXI family solute receptor